MPKSVDLSELQPRVRERVIDLVAQADVDVSAWASFKGGPARAASNPKYCYEWAFLVPHRVAVLNIWFKNIKRSRGLAIISDNLRESAQNYARSGGHPVWIKRALEFDRAVAAAAKEKLPVRAIICDGQMRDRYDPKARSSQVRARELDSVPWAVTKYDRKTGALILTRGALPGRLVDQFDVTAVEDSPTERRATSGMAFLRNPRVRAFALARAKGRCEWCRQPGFTMGDGVVFLETHHVIPLSEGGRDSVTNMVALCPNHHREAHFGARRAAMRERLLEQLRGKRGNAWPG